MLFNTLADVTTMSGLISELGSIITACFNIFTGNWLLMGVLIVAVGVPILGAVFSLIKSRF